MTSSISCPVCAADVVPAEAGSICPQSRTPLPESQIETIVPARRDAQGSLTSSSGWLSSSGSIDHGRFADRAMWPVLLVLGLALFAFYASRQGQPLFGRLLRSD